MYMYNNVLPSRTTIESCVIPCTCITYIIHDFCTLYISNLFCVPNVVITNISFLSGGLVHRSNAASSSSGSGATGGVSEASGWGPPGAEKNLDLPDQDDEGYDDKSEDSKTMRLTLMEEVLLLGIKDREVSCLSLSLSLSLTPSIPMCHHFRVTHRFGMTVSHLAFVAA